MTSVDEYLEEVLALLRPALHERLAEYVALRQPLPDPAMLAQALVEAGLRFLDRPDRH